MPERTTVRLPEDLVRRAKKSAAAEGRTLTALIEQGLREVLDRKAPRAAPERSLPPVSTASGGLAPGVDLEDSAALQEMDDRDFARRL